MQLDDGGSHYRFCFIHFFFQSFSNDIGGLPKELADRLALLPELLKDSRASSTVKSYHSGFIRWKKWALSNELGSKDVLPAKAFHVALYLASIIQTADSASPVICLFVLRFYGPVNQMGSCRVRSVYPANHTFTGQA